MLRLAHAGALVAVLLVAMPAAGSAPGAGRPGFDTAPKISPDGRWILFERYFASGSRYSPPLESLWIVDADGASERELVPATEDFLVAGWTADNLVRISHDQETFLVRPEDGRNLGPAAPATASSPDGRWIAYTKRRELWVSAPDGSNARLVASDPYLIGAFSPDSTRLTYTAVLDPFSSTVTSEIVSIDGTGRVQLKRASVTGPGVWAPDGRSVVLMAQNAERYRYRPPMIYVAKADGSRVRRLVRGFAIAPDWSPRGDWILYMRQAEVSGEDRSYLMRVRPDGRGVRRVRRGGSATWLADGRRALASGNGPCGRAGILELDVFRRTVRRLTNRCRMAGTPGADNLRGTPLRDLVHGLAGDDMIDGRGGDDDLFGGPGNDVLTGGGGRDRFDCGPGRDRVIADRRDVVARNCERVRR